MADFIDRVDLDGSYVLGVVNGWIETDDGSRHALLSLVNAAGEPIFGDTINLDDARQRTRFLKAVNTCNGHVPLSDADLLRFAPAISVKGRDPKPRISTNDKNPDDPTVVLVQYEYARSGPGLVRVQRQKNADAEWEELQYALSNFEADITQVVIEDDGAEERLLYEVSANFPQSHPRRTIVAAEQFARLDWVPPLLGGKAIVYPGARDHLVAAIQTISGNAAGEIPRRRVFTATGWHEVDGKSVYVTAGGALGATGLLEGIEARLPDGLGRFNLPAPPTDDNLVRAIRSALGLLDVAPDTVTVPLSCAIWRAPLGPAPFSVHLAGETGVFKSALGALGQQHYGAGMDADHLPGSFLSTGNATEVIAFLAKDALLVLDDFAPLGSPQDVARAHREADRIIRAQGNGAGRARLRPDGTLRPTRRPRGLVLSTGEDVPRGASTRARLLVVDVGPTDVDVEKLTLAQQEAVMGRYAEAMAGFVTWQAERTARERAEAHRRAVAEYRARSAGSVMGHRRVPTIVGELMAGFAQFLAYALHAGALTDAEADAYRARVWVALGAVAARQGALQVASDPVTRFFELLQASLVAGRAHLASKEGGRPIVGEVNPSLDGSGTAYVPERAFGWNGAEPLGERVGWIDGENLFLAGEVAYAVVQRLARDGGETLAIGTATLAKRFSERRLLKSEDPKREKHVVRKTLGGVRPYVLHLSLATLYGPEQAHQAH